MLIMCFPKGSEVVDVDAGLTLSTAEIIPLSDVTRMIGSPHI